MMPITSLVVTDFLDEFIIYIDQFPHTEEEELVQLTLLGELQQLLNTVEILEEKLPISNEQHPYLLEVIDYISQLRSSFPEIQH